MKTSNFFGAVYLFPSELNKKTFMNNNLEFKFREIAFKLSYNNLGFSVC